MAKKDEKRAKAGDWQGKVTNFLLGGASGMAANLLTGANAQRAIAAFLTGAAVLTGSARLRSFYRKAPRAPLSRYAPPVLLAASLIAAILSLVVTRTLAPYFIFAAVSLTGAAVLIPSDPFAWMVQLLGVGGVGVGVAFVRIGVAPLVGGEILLAVAFFGQGVAAGGLGVALIWRGWGGQVRNLLRTLIQEPDSGSGAQTGGE